MNNENEINQQEVERFERIRLLEIEKLKKLIEDKTIELEKEKSKFFKKSKVIAELEDSIKSAQDKLIELNHLTGYDLYIESKKSGVSKFVKNLDTKKIGTAVEIVGKFIPVPGVSDLGKIIKKL